FQKTEFFFLFAGTAKKRERGKSRRRRQKTAVYFLVTGGRRRLPAAGPVDKLSYAFVNRHILLRKLIVILMILKKQIQCFCQDFHSKAQPVSLALQSDISVSKRKRTEQRKICVNQAGYLFLIFHSRGNRMGRIKPPDQRQQGKQAGQSRQIFPVMLEKILAKRLLP